MLTGIKLFPLIALLKTMMISFILAEAQLDSFKRDPASLPQFDWSLVYRIQPRQFWGIVAGCTVFTVTIGVVFYLLYASGTISSFLEEMRQSFEQSQKKNDGRVPDLFAIPPNAGECKRDFTIPASDVSPQLATQPELYDHLISASRTLPLRPDPTPAPLRGKRILLRPFEPASDIPLLLEASNGTARFGESAYDPARLWGWMDDMLLNTSAEDKKSREKTSQVEESTTSSSSFRWQSHSAETFLSAYNDKITYNGRHMVIVDIILMKPVGMLSLLDNSPKNLTIRIGNIWLTPAYQGKKVAHDAFLVILTWLFDIGYRRVTVEVNHRHVIMRKFLERCGFILEATLRKHKIVQKRNCDTALYVMVNSDWITNELKLKTLLGIEIRPKMKQAGELDLGIKRAALYKSTSSPSPVRGVNESLYLPAGPVGTSDESTENLIEKKGKKNKRKNKNKRKRKKEKDLLLKSTTASMGDSEDDKDESESDNSDSDL